MKTLAALVCLLSVNSALAEQAATKSPFSGKEEAERVRIEKMFEGTRDFAAVEERLGKPDSHVISEIPPPWLMGACIYSAEEHVTFAALRYSRISKLLDVDVVANSKGALVALVMTKKSPNQIPEPTPGGVAHR